MEGDPRTHRGRRLEETVDPQEDYKDCTSQLLVATAKAPALKRDCSNLVET